MSIWSENSGQGVTKYTHWPNPFTNWVKSSNKIACENRHQTMFQFAAPRIMDLFWTDFVPSPVELTRKGLSGSYKCGFYLPGVKWDSPIDIVWRDAKAGKALGEILRPASTLLFFWWASETVWDIIQLWSTIMKRDSFCDELGNETLLANGVGTMPPGHNIGSIGLYSVLYDPSNRYGALGGGVQVDAPGTVSVMACGEWVSHGCTVSNITMHISVGGVHMGQISVGGVAPFEVISWSLSLSTITTGPVNIAIGFECDVEGFSILPTEVKATRFTVTAGAGANQPGDLGNYVPKDYP